MERRQHSSAAPRRRQDLGSPPVPQLRPLKSVMEEEALWAIIENPMSTSAEVWDAWLLVRVLTSTGTPKSACGPSGSGAASSAMSDSSPSHDASSLSGKVSGR